MKRLILNVWGYLLNYERYACTNCKKTNYLKANSNEMVVGCCRKCGHVIWQ